MKIETHTEERLTSLKLLDDKLDSRISPDLKAEFVNLNTKGVKNLILDLDEVKYVDSSGLSSILTANRLFQGTGGVMVICNINPHVNKLITISQLNSVLTLKQNVEEARDFINMRELETDLGDSE
ncbi:MAG: STAS domain-containing protein [Bacteroidia bacterium]|nr:STAS domain-containing protein [Bacteroidia bacterium]